MKVLFLSVLIFGLYDAVSAQPIFKPFEGRRETIRTADFTPGETNLLKTGKTCGRYFSYVEVADQKIVSFKVPISEAESRKGVNDFNRVGLNLLKIKIDNRLKIPAIEYRAPKLNARKKGWRVGICLSSVYPLKIFVKRRVFQNCAETERLFESNITC